MLQLEFGNVKAGANQPHMYLRNVWECASSAGAASQVRKATAWRGSQPPTKLRSMAGNVTGRHRRVRAAPGQCRFRAYASLQDGAKRWLGHHQRIAAKDAGYVVALNAVIRSRCACAQNARYYTASETDYARNMTRTRAQIDKALGPLP